MAIASIVFMAVFVLVFGAILVLLASVVGPKLPRDKVKLESYECGIEGDEKGDTKISVKFYLTAILFIIFDIEIIFMYPWAVSIREFFAQGIGMQAMLGMGFFLFIFIFGLLWEVRSRALEWE